MNAPDLVRAAASSLEQHFHALADMLDGLVAAGETYTANFSAETSSFVRFNRGQVRQPGTVSQRYLELDLLRGARHATQRMSLSGVLADDRAQLEAAVRALRALLPDMADDPHLLYSTTVTSTRDVRGEALPAAEEVVDTVLAQASDLDFVGFYAGGPIARGFANSLGQRNWHEVSVFNLQWSLYHRADKAVKSGLSGTTWDAAAFTRRLAAAREGLELIARPARTLAPGQYRAFLTPAALEEIVGMLGWGGFSARALATQQSSLVRFAEKGERALRLDPRVRMVEATADGLAPGFQAEGFARPAHVPLFEAGRLVGGLTSPRTAREFGGATNGANADETPESLAMDGGALPVDDALAALDTGLYVGNLWYLNYSDRPACRMTGMTRFATFWVENGRIVAPVDVLRFDDTLGRMLGENLEALTRETELRLDTGTYQRRALGSMRLPGALLRAMTFTL